MTKKDYIAIAEVLNANRADMPLVLDMADMLSEDNARFDRSRFVEASTIEWRKVQAHALHALKTAMDTGL